jgi:hypothetical protein
MTTTHLYVPTLAQTDAKQGNAVDAVRAQLRAQHVEGWTEVDVRGYWQGEPEDVVRFEIIGAPHPLAFWREILRLVMPHEDAVLATRSPIETTFG